MTKGARRSARKTTGQRFWSEDLTAMKVIRSNVIGYCFGVANTIEKAEQCIRLSQKEGVPCYSIGSIIHNKDVVQRFQNLGMVTTGTPDDKVPGIALVRAHGITDALRRSYMEAGFTLVDSTCPIVAKGAATIKKAALRGYKTIIIGVKGHAETIGLQGVEAVPGKVVESFLLCSADDARSFVSSGSFDRDEAIVVVVQTTFPEDEFRRIRAILAEAFSDIRFSNSPCGATEKRQKAAIELSENCEAVLVIGGKDSENTKVLAKVVSEKSGKPVFCIENSDDLDSELKDKISGYSTVGVCSGSSTPTSTIREVEHILEKM